MKRIIHTDKAPNALGPYNQAVVVGEMVYTSGQIALDPTNNILVTGSIEEETDRVLKNLQAVLEAAGSSLEHAVSVTVYVTDMNDYSRINSVYARYFPEESAPARALVEVRNLPKFVRVEISAIAILQPSNN